MRTAIVLGVALMAGLMAFSFSIGRVQGNIEGRMQAQAVQQQGSEREDDMRTSATMTKEQAISDLDKLQAEYPGGTRTDVSYRREPQQGAGIIARTIYRVGTKGNYRSINNA